MRRALAVAALALPAVLLAGPAGAAEKVPYEDLQSVGGMTLCDAAGKAVTEGSIDDKPFVWKAVATVAAPAPYDGPGSAAVLTAVQPRQGTYPDRWNSDSLTAATGYDARSSRPTAVATGLDFTLRDFLNAFPAEWDGLVQLRMNWGARLQGFDQERHVSADLKVEGDRWRLLSAPHGDCAKGKGVSTEVSVAGLDTTPKPSAGPGAGGRTAGGAGTGAATGSGATGGDSSPASSGAADAALAGSGRARPAGSASWGTVLLRAGGGLAALALVAFAVSARLRRRRRA